MVKTLLLELNDEVKGTAIDENPMELISRSPEFFSAFSCVVATDLPEPALLKLASLLWEKKIPLCVARAYETMRTYVFFARCYHWTAWFLDLFTDPIFGQLYAFVLRVAAARVSWASELVPVPGGARRVVQVLTSGAHALGPRPVAL